MNTSPASIIVGNHALLQPAPRRAQACPDPSRPTEARPEPSNLGVHVHRPAGMYVTTNGWTYFVRSEAEIWELVDVLRADG